jgi:hypothetical protein
MPSPLFPRALLAVAFSAVLGISVAAQPVPVLAATGNGNDDAAFKAEVEKVSKDPFYKELDEMAAGHNALEVSNHINQRVRQDQNLLTVAMQWLEMRGLHMEDQPDFDGTYLIMYSDYLHNGGDALKRAGNTQRADVMFKNSLLALMTAEAVLMADAKRCEDKTAMNVLRARTLGPRFDALQAAYKLIPDQAYADMSTIALQEEKNHGKRRPNLEICTLGADAINDMKSQKLKKTVIDDPGAQGGKRIRYLLPEGYKYHPKLVPDAQWNSLREGVRDYLKADWPNRYKIYRGETATGGFSGTSGDAKK